MSKVYIIFGNYGKSNAVTYLKEGNEDKKLSTEVITANNLSELVESLFCNKNGLNISSVTLTNEYYGLESILNDDSPNIQIKLLNDTYSVVTHDSYNRKKVLFSPTPERLLYILNTEMMFM